MMKTGLNTKAYDRPRLRKLANVLVAFVLGLFVYLGYSFGKSNATITTIFGVFGFLFAVLLWRRRVWTTLHEALHLGVLLYFGIPSDRIAVEKMPGRVSLNVAAAPKKVWVKATLAPLAFPALFLFLSVSLALYGFQEAARVALLAGVFLSLGVEGDIVCAFVVLTTPGDFVTTTSETVEVF